MVWKSEESPPSRSFLHPISRFLSMLASSLRLCQTQKSQELRDVRSQAILQRVNFVFCTCMLPAESKTSLKLAEVLFNGKLSFSHVNSCSHFVEMSSLSPTVSSFPTNFLKLCQFLGSSSGFSRAQFFQEL